MRKSSYSALLIIFNCTQTEKKEQEKKQKNEKKQNTLDCLYPFFDVEVSIVKVIFHGYI